MFARRLSSALVLALTAVSLIGCGREPRERLQGSWEGIAIDGLTADQQAKVQGPDCERDAEQREEGGFAEDQTEHVRRPGADRAQHRHFPAALAQAGEQRDQHAGEADRHHQSGNSEQRLFHGTDNFPDFQQCRAGQDSGERLGRVLVDESLYRERRAARLQADQDGGDRRPGAEARRRYVRSFAGRRDSRPPRRRRRPGARAASTARPSAPARRRAPGPGSSSCPPIRAHRAARPAR